MTFHDVVIHKANLPLRSDESVYDFMQRLREAYKATTGGTYVYCEEVYSDKGHHRRGEQHGGFRPGAHLLHQHL
jgi:hypothetical protein